MGRQDDRFSSTGQRAGMANARRTMTQARAYQPEDFVDREDLEKLCLGVDFLNYLALKLLLVALLCLVSVEVA
jgi:hypothetical protein